MKTLTLTKYYPVTTFKTDVRPPHINEWDTREEAIEYVNGSNEISHGYVCVAIILKASFLFRNWLKFRKWWWLRKDGHHA